MHYTHNFICIGLAPKADKGNMIVATNKTGAPVSLAVTAARVSLSMIGFYFKREKE